MPRKLLATLITLSIAVSACADPVEPRQIEPPVAVTSAGSGDSGTTTTATNPPGTEVGLEAVIDGDSLAVAVNGIREEVRLIGINTPESDECHGEAARDAMRTIVEGAALVLVASGDEERDQFGRLLRDVFADGVWVNGFQVAEGHAVAVQSGETTEAALIAAELNAFENGRGMWALDACGPIPPDGALQVRVGDVRYDPPGRDFENKEEEFVSIVNEGSAPVDLVGWGIRDESSQHRFTFPAVMLGPGDALRIRTGCGEDSDRDLYWCAQDPVWSNGGDTVILQNGEGTVIDRFKYGGDF